MKPPRVLPFTPPAPPEPIDTTYAYVHNAAGYSTSIARKWDGMGDVPRCHRCPVETCLARRDDQPRCHMAVPVFIPAERLANYGLNEWLADNPGAALGANLPRKPAPEATKKPETWRERPPLS
jgi:hypothetical protein